MPGTKLLFALAAVLAFPVRAGIGVSPPVEARLPLDVGLHDERGFSQPLGEALAGAPVLLLFADYACKRGCESTLARAAQAFTDSGLRAGIDARVFVVGLDPAGDSAYATSMRWRAFAAEPSAASVTRYFTSVDVHRLTRALGYRYTYDQAAQAYVYPEVAFAVGADGRLLHVIAAKRLNADVVRAAFPIQARSIDDGRSGMLLLGAGVFASIAVFACVLLGYRSGAWKRLPPMHLPRLRLRRV